MQDLTSMLPVSYDADLLKESLWKVLELVDWRDEQIALSCHPSDAHSSLTEKVNGKATFRSKSIGIPDDGFMLFVSEFNDTYFRYVWDDLSSRLDRVFRMRLKRMEPKRCLSYHRDAFPRYHIPIITNPRAMFLLSDDEEFGKSDDIHIGTMNAYRFAVPGQLYRIDTRIRHTFINMGDDIRYHLVCSADA